MPLRHTIDLRDFDTIMSRGSAESSEERLNLSSENSNEGEYSLAALRRLNPTTQRIIDDPGWQLEGLESFEHRFSVARYYLPPPPDQEPASTALSDTSSIAPAAAGSSSQTPPLSASSLTLAGGSTNDKASEARPNQNIAGAGECAATLNLAVTWQCSFGFLGCNATFDDFEAWDVHCQAHYRGHLPKDVTCPFDGCPVSFTGNSGGDAWQKRKDHVQDCHELGGRVNTQPDQELIHHLWRTKVITDAEEHELRTCGRFVENSVHLASANSARSRMQRGLHARQ